MLLAFRVEAHQTFEQVADDLAAAHFVGVARNQTVLRLAVVHGNQRRVSLELLVAALSSDDEPHAATDISMVPAAAWRPGGGACFSSLFSPLMLTFRRL